MLLTLLAIAAVPAPITAVTVHPGHARVVRTASLVLDGRQTVELPVLPAAADPDSVRLEAEGAEVQTIELRRPGLGDGPGSDPPALLEIERLDDAIASLERQQGLFQELTAVAAWKPSPPEDAPLPAGKVDPRRWRRALGFLARFCDRMEGQQRALDRRLHDLKAERARHPAAPADKDEELVNAIFARRPGDGGGARPRDGTGWQVVATVEGRGPARLHLHYLVPGADWTPGYEVRLDPRRDEIALALAATVTQQTGEDWAGVALTFSTAHPVRVSTPPRLTAWRIGDRDRFVPEPQRSPAPAPKPPALESARSEDAPPGGAPAGTLQSYVFDQTGAPLKGVKLAARAASGESRLAYTNDEGFAQIRDLSPGSYDVTASAPKLSAVVQRDVRVSASEGAEINLVMEVSTAVEEVMVLERAPAVNVTSAVVSESIGANAPAARPIPAGRSRPIPAGRSRPIHLAPPPSHNAPELEVSFAALLPESVPSGADPRRVPLRSWTFPTKLRRTLYPALSPEAFVLAKLQGPTGGGSELRLPRGEAALFVGDDPAGTAELELLSPGSELELPLGRDRDLRAVRRLTVATRQEGLLRRKEISRHTVTVEIRNPHPRPLRLALHDQIPIAADDQIDSRLLSSTPAATLDRETGALTWQLDLRPAQVTRVTFVYELRYPEDRVVRQEGVTP